MLADCIYDIDMYMLTGFSQYFLCLKISYIDIDLTILKYIKNNCGKLTSLMFNQ